MFLSKGKAEELRDFLKKHDCKICQCYLFSKPVSIDEFEILVG